MQRVQVQDLPEPERFRPVQPTGDTYGGVDKPVIDKNWERLSSALSSFSTAIGGMGRRDNKEQGLQWEAMYQRARQERGNAEAGRMVMSGEIPVFRDPARGPVAANTLGADHARDWLEQQRRDIAQGTYPLFGPDGRPTDVGSVHSQRVQEHYQRQPPQLQVRPGVLNPIARGYQMGFAAEVEKAREEAIAAQRAAVASENNALIDSSITRFLSPIGEAAGRRNPDGSFAVSDEQLAELWSKQRQEIRGFFAPPGKDSLIDYRRIENRTVGLLSDLARDNPEAALRLMQLNRGRTPEGVELGPIIANPTHFDRLRDVERAARQKAMENADAAVLNRAAEEGARQLRAGNGIALQGLTDRSYENPWDQDPNTRTRTLSASRIRDAAYARAATQEETAIRQQGSSPKATEEALFESARRLYIQSNVPNPAWRSSMNEAIRISGDPAALSDPANSAKAAQALDLYERLSREHPGYLKTLGLTDDSERFFQRVATLRDGLGMPLPQAMQEAARIGQNRAPTLDAAARQRVVTEANRLGASWIGWQSAGSNVMEGRRNIENLATEIMGASDIPAEAAVKKAAEILQSRTVVLNGRSHFGDPWVSKESLPFWQSRLAQIVQEHRTLAGSEGGISDPSKLSVVRVNNGGGYAVVDQNGFQVRAPVPDPRNPNGPPILRPVFIEPRSVQNAMEMDRQARKAGELAEIGRQAQIRDIRAQLASDEQARKQGGDRMGHTRLTDERRAQLTEELLVLGDRVVGRAPEDGGPAQSNVIPGRNPFGSTTVDPRAQRMDDQPDPAPMRNPLTDLFTRFQRPEAERQDAQTAQERAANAMRRRRSRTEQ